MCTEYENGTALHIAATNLGVSAVQVLLNFGADPNLTDDLARKAHDCIPEIHAIGHVSHQRLEAENWPPGCAVKVIGCFWFHFVKFWTDFYSIFGPILIQFLVQCLVHVLV